jgi:hypothetical protein
MRKSHVGVQTDLAKKEEKEILEKGPDVSVTIYRGEINLYVSSRITRCIMSTSCAVVKLSQKSLANFCAALLGHAERLQDLLRPSWPDAGEIQDKMYHLVDTLMLNGVDQKWFSSYALVEGAEVMLTTPEICAVSLGFCLKTCNEVLTNRIFANTFLQAAGNVIISCVQAAHEKYQSNRICVSSRICARMAFWVQGITGSSRTGWILTSHRKGTSTLRTGWYRKVRFKK